ncbi:MAG: hypothetical protein Q4C34_00510 [Bacteroidales bacterium]|nr:hypothetical protein [Bacteroidales bacterium]
MKKFYAFAAAAIAAVSMNAQTLYVCGGGEGLGWAPEAPFEVALADGAYTFEVKNLAQFKIATEMGSWDIFNNASYYATVTEEDLGNAVALESMEGVDNPANIRAPWPGDYKIVVAGDLSTITMTTTTPKPVGFTEVFIRGGMNNWGNDGAETLAPWKFSTEDGKTYTFVAAGESMIPANTEFKIADSSWSIINYTAEGEVALNEETEWVFDRQTNSYLAEDFEGTVTLVLPEVINGENPAFVTFTEGNGVSDVAVDANAPAEYFNLQGVRVANPENGLFIVRQGGNVTKVVK